MAILETETQHYYKINFDECSIKGRKVYVNFSSYKSTNDRENEKLRQPKWAVFFQALREKLHNDYTALVQKVDSLGLPQEEILSTVEDNKIDKDKYPELRAEQDALNELEPYEQKLQQSLYCFGEHTHEINIPPHILEKITMLGYDTQWHENPIHITSGAEVFVGEYNDEPICQEFYYNRLKTVMNDSILDC